MANTVVFNKKTEDKKDGLCFEDLEIGDIFMYNFEEATHHFIKVPDGEEKDGYSSSDFNAVCIEDGGYELVDNEETVKKFLGEIALNGTFVADKELN